jgi:acetyl-CoA/propionyl-CoA carboxylase biotin carboxyl carrier protein
MLAKVIAWGSDRGQALHRLDHALADTALLGVTSNIGFLRRLLADPDVQAGALDTGLVERRIEQLAAAVWPEVALASVAIAPLERARAGPHAWDRLVAWRLGRPAATRRELEVAGHGKFEVWVSPEAVNSWSVQLPDRAPLVVESRSAVGDDWQISIDGRVVHLVTACDGPVTHVASDGESWTVTEVDQRGAGGLEGPGSGGELRSPMPGTVIAVTVAIGDRVVRGQAIAVVEAMKMEHTLTAPFEGSVSDVRVAAGASVALDEVLVVIVPSGAETGVT